MKKLLTFFGLLWCCLFACSKVGMNNKTKNNTSKSIIAKWNFTESNSHNCDDDGSNSPTSCVYKFKGKRYLRGESYLLDSIGKIDSIYSYHVPLGLNVYSLENYGRYMMSHDTSGFKKMKMIQIKWDETNNKVIDNDKPKNPTLIEKNQIIIENQSNLIIYEVEILKPLKN